MPTLGSIVGMVVLAIAVVAAYLLGRFHHCRDMRAIEQRLHDCQERHRLGNVVREELGG